MEVKFVNINDDEQYNHYRNFCDDYPVPKDVKEIFEKYFCEDVPHEDKNWFRDWKVLYQTKGHSDIYEEHVKIVYKKYRAILIGACGCKISMRLRSLNEIWQ